MEDITRGKVPTAFLSSTCYDLKQIRTDIKKFFEENLGFDIFLSEYTLFPVNPETICRFIYFSSWRKIWICNR